MNALLRKDTQWSWTSECRAAFQEAKNRLVSSQILVHYDSNVPIVLAGDASAYGVGAVISHVTSDGRERPITFALQALSRLQEELPTIRERSPVTDLRCEEIQQLLVRPKVHIRDGPHTVNRYIWVKERNPTNGSRQTPKMGDLTGSV